MTPFHHARPTPEMMRREPDEIRSLFREGKRLVVVTGIGGIGDSCLAPHLCSSTSDLGNGRRPR
jgi:hypothetical protein